MYDAESTLRKGWWGRVLRELLGIGLDEATGKVNDVIGIRTLDEKEAREANWAVYFLLDMSERAPIMRLETSAQRFFEAVEEVFSDVNDRRQAATAIEGVHDSFETWLKDFRAFDDQTCAWLSRAYGKESSVYRSFKADTSIEFDANLGYRMACGLRNASTHDARVISVSRLTERIEAEEVISEFHLEIDGPKTSKRFRKIRAATRRELDAIDRPIGVTELVQAATDSCRLIYSRLVDLTWPDIQRASIICKALVKEVERRELAGAALAAYDDPSMPGRVTITLTSEHEDKVSEVTIAAREIPMSVVRHFAEKGPLFRRQARSGPLQITADDLIGRGCHKTRRPAGAPRP